MVFNDQFPYGSEPGNEEYFNAGFKAGLSENEALRAENARLREALEEISELLDYDSGSLALSARYKEIIKKAREETPANQ